MSNERIPIDQLLDLVEGNLPEDEAARLEAALDDSDRRELAVQAAVRTVLGQLPDPAFSDDESRRLRAAVRAELRVEEEARPAPSEGRQEKRSWLVRAIPSAAAAASVVAMIAVAINLVGGPDSAQEPPVMDAAAVVTEQAAEVPLTTGAPATTQAAAAEMAAGAPATTGAPAPAAEAPEASASSAEEATAAADVAEPAEAAQAAAESVHAEAEIAMEEALADTPEAEMADEEAGGLGPGYVAFEVATGRPEEAREMLEVLETLAAVTEMAPVPVAELADRAGEEGLVWWPEAAALAGASGIITWMAPGLVDGVPGEAYLVVSGPDDQAEAGVLALFVYPDCRAVALRAVTAG